MNFDLKIGASVAIHVTFDDQKASMLYIMQLTCLVMEVRSTDEFEMVVEAAFFGIDS